MNVRTRARAAAVFVQILGIVAFVGGIAYGGWSMYDSRSTRTCIKPGFSKNFCFEWAGRLADEIQFRFGISLFFTGMLTGALLIMIGAYVQIRLQTTETSTTDTP